MNIRKITWFILILSLAGKISAQDTVYTLEDLLDRALENNYLLKANEKNAEVKRSELELLKNTYLPKISASANFSYWDWLQPNKKNILGGGNTDMLTEVSLIQTVYDWGENKVKKAFVDDELKLNAETERQIRHTIIWGVNNVFVELLKIKSQTEIYRNSISQLQSQLRFTDNLYQIGKASVVDLLRVKVKVSTEEEKLQESLNAEQAQVCILKNMCFVENNLYFEIDTNALLVANSWIHNELLSDTIYNRLSISHPLLKSSEISIEKEAKQKELYRLENRPEFISYAATNWEDNYLPFSNNFNYNLGVGIRYTIPFLGGSGHKTRMQQSDYRISKLYDEQNQLYIDFKSEIDQALNDWIDKQDKLKNIASTIELSEAALQNASIQYQSGQGSLIDVLDAQTVLTASQIDFKQNSLMLLQILARIHYLSGKDNYPFNF